MTVRRLFTLGRRANTILLLVLTILGCAVVAYAALKIYREPTRTRPHAIQAQGGFALPTQLETARLQTWLDSVRQDYALPALGAAVFTKDSVLGLAVVGVRRIGYSTAATARDLFHIGSDTKAMTAGLLGLLVDRGKLRWESRLDEIFPDLEPSMRTEYRDLTVRELLTHRSGIVANPTVSFIDATPLATPRAQRGAFMRWVVQQPLATPRGGYAYANSNYVIAGAIADRLFDGAYEHLLIAELLAPLGITTAGFGAPGRADVVDQPWGHSVGWLGFRRAVPPGPGADNPPVFGSAGRLHLSLPDWARWGQAVIRAARGEQSPWSPATGKSLVTPLVEDSSAFGAAFGWYVGRRAWAAPTGRVLSHAGSNGRWYAVAWLAPDTNFGLLVVTNQGGDKAARAADAAAAGIIRMSRRTAPAPRADSGR
jgi:CubicO group peptidase (beta-lactamase class C family)